jgi:hypothetical protein
MNRMYTLRLLRIVVAAVLVVASLPAFSGVTTFSNRSTFSALGTIAENYGFEDLNTAAGGGVFFPGDPWNAHGVTYNTTGNNIVVGPAGASVASKVFSANSFGIPLNGTMAVHYDLFGFDAGSFLGASPANIVLVTNIGTYSFTNQALPAMPVLSFFGFSAGPGEYFTSFSISTLAASTIPGIDNVTLGFAAVTAVPEPATNAMLLAGLMLLGARVRRRL